MFQFSFNWLAIGYANAAESFALVLGRSGLRGFCFISL
jgi:hypothetical protein